LIAIGLLAWSQSGGGNGGHANLYFEPGTQEIPVKGGGTVQGKIMIDLETGDTWGFPVQGPRLPYPTFYTAESRPQTVAPIYLGRFDVAQARRGVRR
jgi:hypothetical protein